MEPCITVPAVTDVCRPQSAHSQVNGLVDRRQALAPSHPGHRKPSGQRSAARYSTHAASSGKRRWNSGSERGKSVMAGLPIKMFALCSTRQACSCHHISRYRMHGDKPFRRYLSGRFRVKNVSFQIGSLCAKACKSERPSQISPRRVLPNALLGDSKLESLVVIHFLEDLLRRP